jgi:hypothetical protein
MSRHGQLLDAGVFAALGSVIAVASWRMDRLADRGVAAWSAPGLTPGVVGLLMIVLAAVLAWRARRLSDTAADAAPAAPGWARRTLAAVVLCVLFAGVALGHGLPFAVEGAAFIFIFATLFSWREWRAESRIGRGLAQTLAVAVLAAAFIAWLFESVFLVRLP